MTVIQLPAVLNHWQCPYTGCTHIGPGRTTPDEAVLDGLVHAPEAHGTEPPC